MQYLHILVVNNAQFFTSIPLNDWIITQNKQKQVKVFQQIPTNNYQHKQVHEYYARTFKRILLTCK